MAILTGMATLALFLVALGLASFERRLCGVETKIDISTERLVKVETNQNIRLDRERIEAAQKGRMER